MSKKKKITLEQEFNDIKETHMMKVIFSSILHDENIFRTKYFRSYKNFPVERKYEEEDYYSDNEVRAMRIEEDIFNRTENGETGLYQEVYEFCWKKYLKNNNILQEEF